MKQRRGSTEEKRGEKYGKLSTEEKILVNTELTCQAIEMMHKDYSKIVFALLGIVAATLGLKFAGTPWYIDATIYLSLFAGVFVLGVSISFRKDLALPQRVLRFIFSTFMIFNGIVQTVIYQPGTEVAPTWFTPIIEFFLIIIAFCLVWATWTIKPKKVKKEKEDDQPGACE